MTVRYPILAPGVEIKPIPGRTGYHASTDGRIWSQYRTGTSKLQETVHEMKPTPFKHGHPRVGLTVGHGKSQCLYVHRLVLETFVGPCPPGMEGCHDPDPTPANCNISNLRWDTRKANHDDMKRAGRGVSGTRNGKSKLTEDQVREIWSSTEAGVSQRELARRFNLSRPSIKYILTRKNWKHLDGPPPLASRPLLSELQAAEIIKLGRDGMRQDDIAARLKTTQSNVSLILLGKSWKRLHRDDRWRSVLELAGEVPSPS